MPNNSYTTSSSKKKLFVVGWVSIKGQLHAANPLYIGKAELEIFHSVMPSDEWQYLYQGAELEQFFAHLQRTLDNTANCPHNFKFNGAMEITNGIDRSDDNQRLFDKIKTRKDFEEVVKFCHSAADRSQDTIDFKFEKQSERFYKEHRDALAIFLSASNRNLTKQTEACNLATTSPPEKSRLLNLYGTCHFDTHSVFAKDSPTPFEPNSDMIGYREQCHVKLSFLLHTNYKIDDKPPIFFTRLNECRNLIETWLNIPAIGGAQNVSVVPDLAKRTYSMGYDTPPSREEKDAVIEITADNCIALHHIISTLMKNAIASHNKSDMRRDSYGESDLKKPLLLGEPIYGSGRKSSASMSAPAMPQSDDGLVARIRHACKCW